MFVGKWRTEFGIQEIDENQIATLKRQRSLKSVDCTKMPLTQCKVKNIHVAGSSFSSIMRHYFSDGRIVALFLLLLSFSIWGMLLVEKVIDTKLLGSQ